MKGAAISCLIMSVFFVSSLTFLLISSSAASTDP